MNKSLLLSAVFGVGVSCCWADSIAATQLLESALADSRSAMVSATDPAYLQLESTLQMLSPKDLESLLPKAMQCVTSTNPRAKQAGLFFLVAAVQLPQSAVLFDAYVDDFNVALSDLTDPARRQSLIATLEFTRPSMSPRMIQLFLAHLQDKANSPLQTGAIAAALLHAGPSNSALVNHVLSVAGNRSEYDARYPILKEIGLSKIQLPEALEFISSQLNDPIIRADAIVAASRLDRDSRGRFAAQLSRIAQDPDEKTEIRTAAQAAIDGH